MRRSLALVLLLAAARATPATFVASSVEEVARGSDAVVRGAVVRRESRVTPDGRIVTDVDIAVSSVWKGESGAVMTLVVPGGRVGRIAQRVDAAATFADGEEVVVFATRVGARWTVSGYALGKYRVVGGEARPDLSAAEVRPRALPEGERLVEPMSVAELERRVRAAR